MLHLGFGPCHTADWLQTAGQQQRGRDVVCPHDLCSHAWNRRLVSAEITGHFQRGLCLIIEGAFSSFAASWSFRSVVQKVPWTFHKNTHCSPCSTIEQPWDPGQLLVRVLDLISLMCKNGNPLIICLVRLWRWMRECVWMYFASCEALYTCIN